MSTEAGADARSPVADHGRPGLAPGTLPRAVAADPPPETTKIRPIQTRTSATERLSSCR